MPPRVARAYPSRVRPSEVLWAALQAGELDGKPPAPPAGQPLRSRVGSVAALACEVLARAGGGPIGVDHELERPGWTPDWELLRREFLDDWALLRDDTERVAALVEEPLPVEPRIDAYLAALAEHLATQAGLSPPAWVLRPMRFLARWWWPGSARALDALALRDSPAAFRRRGVFVGDRELARA